MISSSSVNLFVREQSLQRATTSFMTQMDCRRIKCKSSLTSRRTCITIGQEPHVCQQSFNTLTSWHSWLETSFIRVLQHPLTTSCISCNASHNYFITYFFWSTVLSSLLDIILINQKQNVITYLSWFKLLNNPKQFNRPRRKNVKLYIIFFLPFSQTSKIRKTFYETCKHCWTKENIFLIKQSCFFETKFFFF